VVFKKHIFLYAVLIASLFCYREINYKFQLNGGRTPVLGSFSGAGIFDADSLYNNPALLAGLKYSHFIFDGGTSIRFRYFRTDYRLAFRPFANIGLMISETTKSGKENKYGFSIYSLFKGLANVHESTRLNFDIIKFAFVQAYKLGTKHYVGYNIGPVLGVDNGEYAVSGNIQLGWNYTVSPDCALPGFYGYVQNFHIRDGISYTIKKTINMHI
jgi:hypothetical protein